MTQGPTVPRARTVHLVRRAPWALQGRMARPGNPAPRASRDRTASLDLRGSRGRRVRRGPRAVRAPQERQDHRARTDPKDPRDSRGPRAPLRTCT